jgi:hypothetical protein
VRIFEVDKGEPVSTQFAVVPGICLRKYSKEPMVLDRMRTPGQYSRTRPEQAEAGRFGFFYQCLIYFRVRENIMPRRSSQKRTPLAHQIR